METWNLFTNSDIILAVIGFVGLVSVGIVLNSASRKVNTREVSRSSRIKSIIEETIEE